MLPREHGAYGQLLFPLLTVLAAGHPSQGYLAAVAWSAAAVCVFLAHEPALVLLGQRGIRTRREQGARARRWVAGLAAIAAVCGALGCLAADRRTIVWLAAPIAIAIGLALLVAARREHTTAGELVSAAAFSALALPVGVAAHLSTGAALTCAVAFWSAFSVATLSVRATITWKRHPLGAWTRAGAVAFAAAAVALVWAIADTQAGNRLARWAALPVCFVAAITAAAAPAPARIRTVGWLLVGATALTALLLVFGVS